MPYTLKTTGLATSLSFCVAVDDDGTTVREFVSSTVNSTMTRTNVTVGTATWKGVSRVHFSSTADGSFNYFGPKFVTNRPSLPGSATGFGVFIAYNQRSAPSGSRTLIEGAAGLGIVEINSAGRLLASRGGGAIGNTVLPTGATKFSVAHNHQAFVSNDFFYGLESGSGAADGTSSDPGFGDTATVVSGIGGAAGQGNSPGQYFIVAGFNRRLTTAEYQSLHDDWFNVLFDSGGGGGGPTHTLTLDPAAFTLTGQSVDLTYTPNVPALTFSSTHALRLKGSGTLLASRSDLKIDVIETGTAPRAVVVSLDAHTTNASGIPAAIADAALTEGDTYTVVGRIAATVEGQVEPGFRFDMVAS